MAMVMLNIGILAIVAAFNAGIVSAQAGQPDLDRRRRSRTPRWSSTARSRTTRSRSTRLDDPRRRRRTRPTRPTAAHPGDDDLQRLAQAEPVQREPLRVGRRPQEVPRRHLHRARRSTTRRRRRAASGEDRDRGRARREQPHGSPVRARGVDVRPVDRQLEPRLPAAADGVCDVRACSGVADTRASTLVVDATQALHRDHAVDACDERQPSSRPRSCANAQRKA